MIKTLLFGPLILFGYGDAREFVTDKVAEIWVSQDRATRVIAKCLPVGDNKELIRTAVTMDVGEHAFVLPPGHWNCLVWPIDEDTVLMFWAIER